MNALSSLVTTTYACLIGTLALLPFAIGNNLVENVQQLSLQTGLGILYLDLFGSALGFSWILRRRAGYWCCSIGYI